jgi:hypothetical protein
MLSAIPFPVYNFALNIDKVPYNRYASLGAIVDLNAGDAVVITVGWGP